MLRDDNIYLSYGISVSSYLGVPLIFHHEDMNCICIGIGIYVVALSKNWRDQIGQNILCK